jgi:signal transduction histidine kinase
MGERYHDERDELFVAFVRAPESIIQSYYPDESTKHRLNLALSATKTGVWDWDFNNDILYWDDTMFEIFCVPKDSFRHRLQDLTDLILPEDLTPLAEKIDHVMKTGEEFIWTFRIKTKEGIKHIAARGWVLKNQDGKTWFTGMNWDVTKDYLQQETIRSQQAKMVASARLSSLGEMAGGIAHEINNPLAIIQGKAESMLRRERAGNLSPDQLEQGLDKIIETCERIVKIIKGLKSFSRNSENDPFELISLTQVIEDVLRLTIEKFRANSISITTDIPEDFFVSGRAAQIGQVLMNLLSNSFDVLVDASERWVKIEVNRIGQDVRVRITDSGPGVPENIREKIMHPFFTTKDIGKGTGLGLSISRGIIEDHGGRFYLDPDLTNTSFVFELPLVSGNKSGVKTSQPLDWSV